MSPVGSYYSLFLNPVDKSTIRGARTQCSLPSRAVTTSLRPNHGSPSSLTCLCLLHSGLALQRELQGALGQGYPNSSLQGVNLQPSGSHPGITPHMEAAANGVPELPSLLQHQVLASPSGTPMQWECSRLAGKGLKQTAHSRLEESAGLQGTTDNCKQSGVIAGSLGGLDQLQRMIIWPQKAKGF